MRKWGELRKKCTLECKVSCIQSQRRLVVEEEGKPKEAEIDQVPMNNSFAKKHSNKAL